MLLVYMQMYCGTPRLQETTDKTKAVNVAYVSGGQVLKTNVAFKATLECKESSKLEAQILYEFLIKLRTLPHEVIFNVPRGKMEVLPVNKMR